MRLPLAREGYPFIGASALLVIALYLLGTNLVWLAAPIFVFVLNFFRDPERVTPPEDGVIVSPADGRVIKVTPCNDDQFLRGPAILVSIFMSPLDVHVNRIPLSGRVVDVRYRPGRFLRAYADDASLHNESSAVIVEDSANRRICFVQVAGFVARRIVNYLEVGGEVRRGDRYGMIRFGSRADIYLPTSAAPAVAVGDRTTGGVTVIARWK